MEVVSMLVSPLLGGQIHGSQSALALNLTSCHPNVLRQFEKLGSKYSLLCKAL